MKEILWGQKMKKVWALILAILLLACTAPQAAAEEGILRESVDNTRPKIISVIFDDSTSMIQDDEGIKKFTTRWVDADYAVKAMASMMDEADTLRLYIMGDYRSEEDVSSGTRGPTTVTFSNKKNAIAAIETRMSNLQSQNETYSLAMNAAKNDFTRSELLNKECWIVILTDGRFTSPERLDGTMLKEKLVNLTQVNAGSLHVAYVPIGNGATQLEEDAANHIIVPKEKQDVTKQVTEIINRIYGRVRMDDTVSRQYLITEEDRIIIRPNVPMEKVVVFLQYQGAEEAYISYAARLSEGEEATDNLLMPPLAPSAPSYLYQKETSYFGGKQEAPISPKKIESVRYHVLQGAVFTWESNSAIADVNFADQEIVIPITKGMNIQKEVYYQPAVRVGFDYLLDGAPVEHTPECGFTGTPIEEENCIQEGMLDVRLKMLDTRGDELPDPFSPFLYPDKFIVELYPEDKSERVVLQGSGLTYQYQGAVDQKKYVMQIQTPWNEVLNQTIDVLEKRKPLEIMPVSSEIVVDDVPGERRLLTVQVNEGGEPISEANAGYVDINCVCDDEGLLVERQAAQLDGRWSFLVTLKNPSQHQIAETALFHLTAVRNYSKGGPTEWTQDVELPLTSDPHTMEIQYEEETVIRAVCNLLTSQPIAIDYCCDGELLTDEQRQKLVVELTEGDQAARKFIRVDDDGNLLIRRSLHWWNMSEEALSAVLMVKYTKYNRACEETFSINFAVKPIGTVLKVNVVAGAVLLLGWVLGCIIKCFTPVHIKKREFFLKKEGRGVPYKLKLGRRRNLFLPFWQKATLSLKQSLALGGVEPMPGIKLEIRNRPGGDGFILCNWQDFTDAERFRIGNLPISEQNSIFSSSRRFSLKNGFGEFVNLSIEERH